MTSTILIESVKASKSGKSLVISSGGSYYSAKLESGLLGKQGQTIEAETESSEYPEGSGKYMVWINKWKISSAPNGSSAAPQQSFGPPKEVPSNTAPWWAPMCSNVLAHAIQAGHCGQPSEVAAWANAVKEWAEGGSQPF